MIPPEERDWDKYLSKDNHSREELSPEEQDLLRAYEENQKEIDQSGIPKWISDIFSYTPLDFKCSYCGQRFTPQFSAQQYCSDYCFHHDQI